MENDDDLTLNSSTSEDTWRVVANGQGIPKRKVPRAATSIYRGFSTSFAQSFVNLRKEKIDFCSLICCGIMQRDRNSYLMTGVEPPSCVERAIAFIFIPFCVISVAVYLLAFMKTSTCTIIIGTILLVGVAAYAICECGKISYTQSSTRKSILRLKYQQDGGMFPPSRAFDKLPEHLREDYMMGQTDYDLGCSQGCCGCYADDITYEEMAAPPPENLCSCLWRCLMNLCCGVCGQYVQCCGICGLAQESREIERIVPDHERAIDYLTMQPVLAYYVDILQLRAEPSSNIFEHFLSLSNLSIQILQSFVLGVVSIIVFCLMFEYTLDRLGILVAIFLAAILLLLAVHWPYNKHNLSVDAALKFFASGFCIAGVAAFLIQVLLSVLLQGIMYSILLLDEGYIASTDDFGFKNAANCAVVSLQVIDIGIPADFSELYYILYTVYLFIQSFFVVAFINELMKYFAWRVISDHPDFWSVKYLEDVVEATIMNPKSLDGVENLLHDVPISEQERTPRSRCLSTMVAMISVSLGFTCCQSALFIIFLHGSVDMNWQLLLVRLLFLLFQPVCAIWVTIGICRRDIEFNRSFQLGKILSPAVFWQGLFNLCILLGDFLIRTYDLKVYDLPMELLYTYAIPGTILLFSILFALKRFGLQRVRLERKNEEWMSNQRTWSWYFHPGRNLCFRKSRRTARNQAMPQYVAETGIPLKETKNGSIEVQLLPSPKMQDEKYDSSDSVTISKSKKSAMYSPPAISYQKVTYPAPTLSQLSSQFSANSIESKGSAKSGARHPNSDAILDSSVSSVLESTDDQSERSTFLVNAEDSEEQNLSKESILSESTAEYETSNSDIANIPGENISSESRESSSPTMTTDTDVALTFTDLVKSSIDIQQLFQDDGTDIELSRLSTNYTYSSYDSSSLSQTNAHSFVETRLFETRSSSKSEDLITSGSSAS